MLRCPRCGKPAARRSRRVGAWDHLLSVLHLYPFRCQLCTARFRAFQAQHSSRHGEDRRQHDRLLVRVPVSVSAGDVVAAGETLALSLDGCSIQTETPFAPGTTVSLRLRLGETGDVLVPSAAVRAQREGVVGVEFVVMAAADTARLSRYLARFLRPTGSGHGHGAPRPQLVLVAAVGLAVILIVLLLMNRVGGPRLP